METRSGVHFISDDPAVAAAFSKVCEALRLGFDKDELHRRSETLRVEMDRVRRNAAATHLPHFATQIPQGDAARRR